MLSLKFDGCRIIFFLTLNLLIKSMAVEGFL